eukprot:3518988-Rhodomonas_salina.1
MLGTPASALSGCTLYTLHPGSSNAGQKRIGPSPCGRDPTRPWLLHSREPAAAPETLRAWTLDPRP